MVNGRSNPTTSDVMSPSMGNFRAAIRRLDDSIIEEFGDPEPEEL